MIKKFFHLYTYFGDAIWHIELWIKHSIMLDIVYHTPKVRNDTLEAIGRNRLTIQLIKVK